MSSLNTEKWNRILVRFLLAFSFWEAVSIPLRMLFFSKFYFDPNFKGTFILITDVFWLAPVFSDLVFTLSFGVLYSLIKDSLPEGLVGGFLVGILVSIIGFVSPMLWTLSLTNFAPPVLVWVWVAYYAIFTTITAVIYSVGWNSED
ncbi:hypothetical protein JWG41_07915 [Leptospira sp. 201903075]|uniref:hypothetical protein n=1 Tax=Leptospira chreensis TaxID=2810035 RepID=UPI00196465B3|nr:hypothetical protein [Leptospira chreensis]MBM9590366.1 hypothetical protein [Leptospira chreensis]